MSDKHKEPSFAEVMSERFVSKAYADGLEAKVEALTKELAEVRAMVEPTAANVEAMARHLIEISHNNLRAMNAAFEDLASDLAIDDENEWMTQARAILTYLHNKIKEQADG